MSSIKMEFTYPRELERAKAERWPILIPIGTMEYHSAICPFGCDSLVAMGLIDKIAEKVDCVVMPPVWYGVASYAVAGPERGTIQVDCDTFEQNIYCILKSLFLAGFNRNIYLVICHQTEDFNPMELACRKAARKLVFEYLDQTKGYGWWGKNENKEFYRQMSAEDNPWNWIQVMGTGRNLTPVSDKKWGGYDHAGRCECSVLEHLYPGAIKLERLPETDDWFAQDSKNMDVEHGKDKCEEYVDSFVKFINAQRGVK